MSERRARYDVDEYLGTDETVLPQELVWGVVRDAPSPAPPHQGAVLRFAIMLHHHVEGLRLGEIFVAPMDCVFDRERALIVQPDILFVSNERKAIVSDRVWGAPDLVVEVLSPQPRIGTLKERLEWFATYGVRECWLYHQFARELDVIGFGGGRPVSHRRFGFHDRIESAVLPRFDPTCAGILGPPGY